MLNNTLAKNLPPSVRKSILDIQKHYDRYMEIQDLDGATNDQMGQIFKSSDRRHAVQSVLNLDESSDSEMQEGGDSTCSPGEELLKRKKTLTMQSRP